MESPAVSGLNLSIKIGGVSFVVSLLLASGCESSLARVVAEVKAVSGCGASG